jgi:hypothetical protein
MPRNARTDNARHCLRWAVLSLLLAAHCASAHAQDVTAEQEAYLATQRRMHKEVAAISNDLNADVAAPGNQARRDFNQSLGVGIRTSDPQFESFRAYLRYNLFRFTNPELKKDPLGLQGVKTAIEGMFRQAGNRITGQAAREDFREIFFAAVLEDLKELLQNNYEARSVAIELLPGLLMSGTGPRDPVERRRILPAVPGVLAGILLDEEQPDTVKVRAVQSMQLYMARVNASALVEVEFATAIKDELESALTAAEYQFLMVDTLGFVQAPREVAGGQRALVFEALADVIQDKRRHFRVRCRAAGALGRVGFDNRINFEPLAWKTVQLAIEVGSAYNDDSLQPYWPECGLQLYLAFHHLEADGATARSPQGMLNRAPSSELINLGYAQVLPIAKGLYFKHPAIPVDVLASARTWVADNKPNDLKFDPASTELQP